MIMKKIWSLFLIIGCGLPLHGMQLQETGRALIPAFSSDDVPFEVEEGVLKKSQLLKKIMENYGESSSEESYLSGSLSLGKSAKDFELILPLLQAIREPQEDENSPLQDLLSQKTTGNIARIVELANFFDVPQIIGCGSVELKKRLDVLCRQPQGNLEGAIKSFLESMQPLTMSTSKLVAHKIIENHPAKGWLIEILSKKISGVDDCVLSKDGKCLVTFCESDSGERLKIWNIESGNCIHTLYYLHDIRGLALSKDAKCIVFRSSSDERIKIWNAESDSCIHTLDNDEYIEGAILSKDGKCLVTWSWSPGMVKIWNIESGNCIHTLDHGECIRKVILSKDGKCLIVKSDSGMVKIWDIESGNCIHTLDHGERIRKVILSKDGKCLVTWSDSGMVKIWDIESANCIHTLDHGDHIGEVILSKDGKCLVTWSIPGMVKMWNIESGNCIHTLDHGEDINRVILSKDDKYLVVRSDSGMVKIWNTESGNCIHTLGHGGNIKSVKLSKDGKYLVVRSDSGMVKILNLDVFPDITLKQAVASIIFRDKELLPEEGEEFIREYYPRMLPKMEEAIDENGGGSSSSEGDVAQEQRNEAIREEQKRPFYSRMMWRCKNVFSKVAVVINLKNHSDQSSSKGRWWHFNSVRRGIGSIAIKFAAIMRRLWVQ